jgi:hypothetical protein
MFEKAQEWAWGETVMRQTLPTDLIPTPTKRVIEMTDQTEIQ